MCPRCERDEGDRSDGREEGDIRVEVTDSVMEELEQYCYLGDMLDCETGVERSARARAAAAWGRWQRVASLVINPSIDLKTKGRV